MILDYGRLTYLNLKIIYSRICLLCLNDHRELALADQQSNKKLDVYFHASWNSWIRVLVVDLFSLFILFTAFKQFILNKKHKFYYVFDLLSIVVNIGRDKKKRKNLVCWSIVLFFPTEITVALISAFAGGVGFLLIIVIAAFCCKRRRRRRRGKRASKVFQQDFT